MNAHVCLADPGEAGQSYYYCCCFSIPQLLEIAMSRTVYRLKHCYNNFMRDTALLVGGVATVLPMGAKQALQVHVSGRVIWVGLGLKAFV
jgi:hypothetical protein